MQASLASGHGDWEAVLARLKVRYSAAAVPCAAAQCGVALGCCATQCHTLMEGGGEYREGAAWWGAGHTALMAAARQRVGQRVGQPVG